MLTSRYISWIAVYLPRGFRIVSDEDRKKKNIALAVMITGIIIDFAGYVLYNDQHTECLFT